MKNTVFAAIASAVLFAAPSFAGDTTAAGTETTAVAAEAAAPAPAVTAIPTWKPASRPAILPALYAGSAALQAYDAYSTSVGLRHGAVEANPMMSGIVGTTATLLAVKAAVTTTTFLVSERLWKQHRRGHAVAVMVISNGLMAAVAARNHAVLHEQR